jgi:DDE superfamily endonuclease
MTPVSIPPAGVLTVHDKQGVKRRRSDDEDDFTLVSILLGAHSLFFDGQVDLLHDLPAQRRVKFTPPRSIFRWLIETRLHDKSFKNHYGMDFISYRKLVDLIREDLQVNELRSMASTGQAPITPEMAVHCALSWLKGGRYQDIRSDCGMSKPTFFVKIWQVFDAINRCKALDFQLPQTANAKFHENHPALRGLQASFMDGWQCFINTPSVSDVEGPVIRYYNGHYKRYGINVQAMCDGKCRFTFVCVAAPGGQNDIQAYEKSSVGKEFVKKLPPGFFVVADNAYLLSPEMLVPFKGPELGRDVTKDVYNFFLSQMRIRIEMAFGMLVMKWRRFCQALHVSTTRASSIIQAARRLHNFCIDERTEPVTNRAMSPINSGVMQASAQVDYFPSDNTYAPTPSEHTESFLRDQVLQWIEQGNYSRPGANKRRRRLQDHWPGDRWIAAPC